MNTLLTLLLGMVQTVSAQSITWSTPVPIGNASASNGLRPRIAITDNGEVNVIWGRDSLIGEILHARAVGGVFGPPVTASIGTHDVEVGPSAGPNIAAKGNDVYISYGTLAPNTGRLYTIKSSDAGTSWADPVWLDQYLSGGTDAILPHVAIDGVGHPHAAMLRYAGSWSAGAVCSVNLGASYTTFVPADGSVPGSPCVVTDPFIVIDGNKHVVLWRLQNGNDHPIHAALSTNNGASFTVKKNIDDGTAQDISCNASGPEAIIAADSLIYAWVSPVDNGRVKCGAADMVGLNAATPVTLDQGATPTTIQRQPTIAGGSGMLGLGWVDDRTGLDDVYFAWSTSGPSGITLVSALPPAAGPRHSPSLAFRDSTFHLVYVDEAQAAVMYATGLVDASTSVPSTHAATMPLQVWPNPAAHSIDLHWDRDLAEVRLRIRDLSGTLVLTKDLANAHGAARIDVSALATGPYVVELRSQGHVGRTPLVVLR